MRAITVRQPYAQLIATGAKRYETRGYQPRCVVPGDRIAIHAGATPACVDVELISTVNRMLQGQPEPLGVIVATARFSGAFEAEALSTAVSLDEVLVGDWSPGRYAWHLTDVRPLAEPAPCRGALGLWLVPDDIAAQVASAGGTEA